MRPPNLKTAGPKPVPRDRLDSWKEIAAYLKRDVRTVQRWEGDLSLPVQRLPGGPKAGVFAMRAELDDWLESRRTELEAAGNDVNGDGAIGVDRCSVARDPARRWQSALDIKLELETIVRQKVPPLT